MQKEIEVIALGDKEYYIINEVKHNGTTYIYLSNVIDYDDTLIRKSSKDEEDMYIPLETEEEFELACLLLFRSKKDA